MKSFSSSKGFSRSAAVSTWGGRQVMTPCMGGSVSTCTVVAGSSRASMPRPAKRR